MTAKILDGASVAQAIRNEVAGEVAEYSKRGLLPGLAAVLVGSDSASQIYVSGKVRICEQLGLYSEKIELPETTTTEELLALVRDLKAATLPECRIFWSICIFVAPSVVRRQTPLPRKLMRLVLNSTLIRRRKRFHITSNRRQSICRQQLIYFPICF